MLQAVNNVPAGDGGGNEQAAFLAACEAATPAMRRAFCDATRLAGTGLWTASAAFSAALASPPDDLQAWQEVEGATGPFDAAWKTLSRAEEDMLQAESFTGLLNTVAEGGEDIPAKHLRGLAVQMRDRVAEMAAAIQAAMELLSPHARAEKGLQAERATAASRTPEARLRGAEALHDAAVKMLADAKAEAAKAGVIPAKAAKLMKRKATSARRKRA